MCRRRLPTRLTALVIPGEYGYVPYLGGYGTVTPTTSVYVCMNECVERELEMLSCPGIVEIR